MSRFFKKTRRNLLRLPQRTLRRLRKGRSNRRASHTTAKDVTFNALKVAQEILDTNCTIVVYENKIGVLHPHGEEKIYTSAESKKIIGEFHEMFNIAKRCTLLCDPLRKKLQKILFICQPIGLADARAKERGEE